MQEQKSLSKFVPIILYVIYGLLITYPLIFIGIYAYSLNGILATALIYAASAFSMGITPIFIAPISDKTGYRLRYAITSLLIGSTMLLLSTFFEDNRIITILILILASAILQIGQPLFVSYETERSKQMGSSVGKVFLYINLGYFIGSILFGFIIYYLSFRVTSISISLLGILISIIFLFFKEERIYNPNYHDINIIKLFKATSKITLIYSMLVFAPAFVYSIVPVYYVTVLKGSVLDWGLVNALSTLAGMITSPYIGNLVDRLGTKRVLLIGSIYYPAYYATLLIYPDLIIFAIFYAMPFWLFIWIPLFSHSALISEKFDRATYVSNMNLLIGLFRTLGGIVAGILLSFVDITAFLLFATIISIAIPLILLFSK
ncbi:MAG: MFS transporter [Thermoproteota archaeon]|jgi:MFS family permease|nr:MFS transporter [Thermoproteota archaeon]